MMAVIQKRLLGRGTDNMAHKKMRMGSTSVAMEAEIMWLRMMTR